MQELYTPEQLRRLAAREVQPNGQQHLVAELLDADGSLCGSGLASVAGRKSKEEAPELANLTTQASWHALLPAASHTCTSCWRCQGLPNVRPMVLVQL